ncbi:MAG: DUF87 domain-containing protein, partial [Patescibacteria group bacterium]
MNNDEKITYFGETDSRNKRMPFGIKNKDRSRHMYVIGKTGMGKSTLLENMAVQDIQNGEGIAFIDPHGKTADLLLEYVPQHRIKDVVYFAPFDTEFPISFNVMEDVGPNKRHLVANGLMSAFKKIWVDAWSARMEYILNNILLALLEYPDSTLIGVNRMLSDKDYRKLVVDNISDPSVKSFWVDEFAKYGEKYMQEAGAAIQNKIGQFVSNPLLRNIIGQPKSSFDIRKIMDEKKIMIINLSKGRVGEANANLLGSMIITKIFLAALSRADVTESKLKTLPPLYLFVDEFQNFANESFADILSEARKYKLSLTVAHQYIEQMSEEVRAAVFGNVGTMITFRVGAYDAEVLEKEFAPTFTAEDLVNLGFVQTYLKLMIDGVTSPPFSAATLPPIKKPDISFRNDIIEKSREQFANPRAEVDETIRKWHAPVARPAPPPRPASSEEKKLPPKPAASSSASPAAPTPAHSAPHSAPRPAAPVTSAPVPAATPVVPVKPAVAHAPAPAPHPAPTHHRPAPHPHTAPVAPAATVTHTNQATHRPSVRPINS